MSETQAQEYAKLADSPEATQDDPPEPDAAEEAKKAEEAAKAEAEEKAKAEKEAEEEKSKKWSVPLQRMQQRQASADKKVDKLLSMVEKLAKLTGVEEEAAPAAPAPAPESPEIHGDLAATKREVEFIKIRQANPEADPDKMWDESIAEVLDLHGIDPNDEELPEGVTQKALSVAANKLFQKKVAALKPVKKAEAEPPKAPPKTPGGASVKTKTASPVPSTPAQKARFDREAEYRKLAGLE